MPATVTYDDTTRTATLTPTGNLAYSTAYTASLGGLHPRPRRQAARALRWPGASRWPIPCGRRSRRSSRPDGASDIGAAVKPRATFSKSLDPTTITASTFTLTGPGGGGARDGRLRRHDPHGDLDPERCVDGRRVVHRAARWSDRRDGRRDARLARRSGRSPSRHRGPPPTDDLDARPPVRRLRGENRNVTAAFSRSMDPATLTSSTFTLHPPGGAQSPPRSPTTAPRATRR